MGIVVHSYASRWNSKTASTKYPASPMPIDLIDHCHQIGAGGVQVVVNDWTTDFAKKVRDQREKWACTWKAPLACPKTPKRCPAFEQEVINCQGSRSAHFANRMFERAALRNFHRQRSVCRLEEKCR